MRRIIFKLFCLLTWGVFEVALTISGLRLTLFLLLQARNAAPAVFNAASIQARTYVDAKASPTEVSSILEQRIRGVQEEANLAETGRVLSVGYVEEEKKLPVVEVGKRRHHNLGIFKKKLFLEQKKS